jgi:two-component system, OmpR family, phosphate regulon response regulator PhoB
VEDEERLLLLLRCNLEAEGYAVDTASQGDEAILKIDEDQPDLVVLDWMTPQAALWRRIGRGSAAARNLWIVSSSCHGAPLTFQPCQAAIPRGRAS